MSHATLSSSPTLPKLSAFEQTRTDPLQIAVESRDADMHTIARDALAAGRAQLVFQPVVVAGENSTVSFYESLIRLMDETGRVIPAAHFMPIFEQSDLGRQIDTVSLDLALRMLRHNPKIRLSVNVSARSLADSSWRRRLEAGIAEHGSLGDRLILEINESSAMLLHEIVIRFMREIQPRGVAFALDGFGGGMIAFRHLRDFFFDLVKIDKSFCRGVARNPDNQVLAEALTMVAHQFEMFAVADGIEAAEDADFMTRIGVDCLQGFHIGKPKVQLY